MSAKIVEIHNETGSSTNNKDFTKETDININNSTKLKELEKLKNSNTVNDSINKLSEHCPGLSNDTIKLFNIYEDDIIESISLNSNNEKDSEKDNYSNEEVHLVNKNDETDTDSVLDKKQKIQKDSISENSKKINDLTNADVSDENTQNNNQEENDDDKSEIEQNKLDRFESIMKKYEAVHKKKIKKKTEPEKIVKEIIGITNIEENISGESVGIGTREIDIYWVLSKLKYPVFFFLAIIYLIGFASLFAFVVAGMRIVLTLIIETVISWLSFIFFYIRYGIVTLFSVGCVVMFFVLNIVLIVYGVGFVVKRIRA